MFQHLTRHKYIYSAIGFIILCSSTFNNLPYGDDNRFVFDSYLHDVSSIWNFWNPYSVNFKSWPLSYTIFSALMKSIGPEVWVYRVLNALIHIGNSFLFLNFVKLWRSNSSPNERYLVFILFLIHPISLITFNWVFQLKTLLCMTFSLATLISIEKIKEKAAFYIPLAFIFFLLALNSKIAAALLPFYLFFKYKDFKRKSLFFLTVFLFFFASLYYGLINFKGINSFYIEKISSSKSVTEYSEDPSKMKVPAKVEPSDYSKINLAEELKDSAQTVRGQFEGEDRLKQKVALSMFTFGRYVNSTLGLNKYAIVYERNLASLEPGVIMSFIFVTFIFLFLFVDKNHIKSLVLVLIFFLPISGIFYVPYMRFSFIADHWFYLALPFMLSFFIFKRPKTLQYLVAGLIIFQFISTRLEFSNTSKIIGQSLRVYKNPFLYEYMIDQAQKNHHSDKVYALANSWARFIGNNNERIIKLKLKSALELKDEDHFPVDVRGDLKTFINYSITNGNIPVALTFINNYQDILTKQDLFLYKTLIEKRVAEE